jgi:capsular polysaccharide biosynthesis protein
MSVNEEQEELRFKRKIRPKFHKALVVALVISLILAVMLIMFLSRYLSAPRMEENGLLDRTTPLMVTASGSLTKQNHLPPKVT